jgi:hypothetical protein
MARANLFKQLLQRVAADPNLQDPERWRERRLVQEIITFAAASPEEGRLVILGSVTAWVSRRFPDGEPISETQAETQLKTLETLSLIEVDHEAGCIWLGAARTSAGRVEAARTNGNKGGRPLKGESKEEYRARKERERAEQQRQGHLMMPIAGGRAETQETQGKPSGESSRAVTTTTTFESLSGSGGNTAREVSALGSLGEELAAAAHLDADRRLDPAPVEEWLQRGATPELLKRVVATLASRKTYHPSRVCSWRFFADAVEQALAVPVAAARPVPTVVPAPSAPQPINPACEVPEAASAWTAIHEALQEQVGPAHYRAWLSPLTLQGFDAEGYALIAAPSLFKRDRINSEFGVQLEAACRALLPNCRGFVLEVAEAAEQRWA